MGCPKNFNDSESIGGIWESTGMSLTDDPAEADAILVNTCGFINDAKQESIGCIFDMARFIDESEKQAPDHEKKILIVSGCLSQRYGKELADEMPEVDIFLGVNDYEKLPQLVKEYRKGKRLQAFSCQPDAFYEFFRKKDKGQPLFNDAEDSRRLQQLLRILRDTADKGCIQEQTDGEYNRRS